MTTEGPEPTLVEWEETSIRFKGDVDVAALFAAIEPPPDIADHHPLSWAAKPDSLERRFLCWGWSCDDLDGAFARTGRPVLIGVYGDYTTLEEDERFMPKIAPFVAAGSSGFFKLRGRWSVEGWDFNGTGVRRRKAEALVEYQWA